MRSKRKLLLTAAFTALLGVGTFAGVSLSKGLAKPAEVEAATPSSYSHIYRFTAPSSWSTTYVHAWGGESSGTVWPGINISSEYSYNEQNRKVFTFATNDDYKYLIFHNNNKWQTKDITIGTDTAWYLDDGDTPGTWTPSNQTYYFYDYRNLFGGEAKCYAWQSNGSLTNASYPGVAMTSVQYGSGQLYSITLDPAFDEFKLGIGDSSNTGDVWINQHRGECYCFWETNPGWSDDLDWVKAHDWIYQTMHMRDIPQETTSDTGACRGANGYYAKAKNAYQNYPASVKTKMSQDDLWGAAQTRFSAWAAANGETASFSGTTLTVKSAFAPLTTIVTGNSGSVIAIIVISAVSLVAVGGYFLFRKKKEN